MGEHQDQKSRTKGGGGANAYQLVGRKTPEGISPVPQRGNRRLPIKSPPHLELDTESQGIASIEKFTLGLHFTFIGGEVFSESFHNVHQRELATGQPFTIVACSADESDGEMGLPVTVAMIACSCCVATQVRMCLSTCSILLSFAGRNAG